MRHLLRITIAVLLTFGLTRSAFCIAIATVPIGDLENPNDPATGSHFGGVNYAFNIGLTEVTNGQYTAFLNAVASTDTYGLYDSGMSSDTNVSGIARSISAAGATYTSNRPNYPVAYIDWGDAARFANWLHNGQPSGPQDSSTTEDGAYALNGAVSRAALLGVTRNPNAKWFLPTESEWYKAAYYQPPSQGGDADGYWAYPMRNNAVPYSDQPPGGTPNNSRVGNFDRNDNEVNGYNDGYAMTGSSFYSTSAGYLSVVGAYASSPSYYGTFDQGGNLTEWNETTLVDAFSQANHGVRGGAWNYTSIHLEAAVANLNYARSSTGFRMASAQTEAGVFGDFSGDGSIDAADYILWRDSRGSVADNKLWRSHFGETIGGTSKQVKQVIPEPSTVLLGVIMTALATGYCLRRI